MKAKKENKVYSILSESQKKDYLNRGYDIYDDDDNVVEYSPKKKISYNEYMKLKEENEMLKKKAKIEVKE